MGARVIELLLNNPGVDLFSRLPSSTFSVIWCAGYSQRVIPVLSSIQYILKYSQMVIPFLSCWSQVMVIPGQSFFFAFGAGHFVGEHTILDVVRKAGFRVDQVAMRMETKMVLLLLKMITMNMKMYKSQKQNGRWRSLMI